VLLCLKIETELASEMSYNFKK
jgi:hypothetical protein